jgi:hypothetical protein
MGNLFDAKKKAVVTAPKQGEVVVEKKPVATNRDRIVNWITIDVRDGEYVVLVRAEKNGAPVLTKMVPAIDINDAEMMFDQYAFQYIKDREVLKEGGEVIRHD